MRGFGELEQAIMDEVWAAEEPLPVREVRERLRPERELAYNTVQTVMEILYRKGWLGPGQGGPRLPLPGDQDPRGVRGLADRPGLGDRR
jgi:hypothetical protein